MRLTIIPGDKAIGIGGEFLLKIQEDLSWIPSNIHAVQWNGESGHIEYKDETPNELINDLGIYEQAIDTYNNEKQRIEDQKIAKEAERDYWEELRSLRDQKLTECDWTQIPDAPLTQEQKTTWATYRQQLRDLPKNITDPKVLVNDSSDSGWPIEP
jgi:hypothetical protein